MEGPETNALWILRDLQICKVIQVNTWKLYRYYYLRTILMVNAMCIVLMNCEVSIDICPITQGYMKKARH